ncbi:fimbria/pilus periplasmic chaperone [Aeromonas salmonicida]|uniref:fimbria/pilus periplasmic chaperone n=1 Tax=Aeromonas salmonicida TaxID=645 RepID=UPI00285CF4C1|nr:fimbria/pilus periplasmic chaperone [Aeromonas salmonicida]MDR7019091.1 P pilus assembly chaperone PapD [Aeromonas salmonicida]
MITIKGLVFIGVEMCGNINYLFFKLIFNTVEKRELHCVDHFVLKLMLLFFLCFTGSAFALENDSPHVKENMTYYSVGLGSTRIIYSPKSKGATISINNPNEYPMLVQSSIKTEENQENAPFIITPPLFRLNSHQQNKIKIIMTNEPRYNNQESLYWFCAMGIPPKNNDAWAGSNSSSKDINDTTNIDINVRVSQCIKILVRPSSLKIMPDEISNSIKWSIEGGKLKAVNMTPFYINVNTILVDGVSLKNPSYIPPMKSRYYKLPLGENGRSMEWTYITDPGGVSTPIKLKLQ